MEGRGEAERQAWEAQVDEAVAVVSVAGEEAAALLARRRRRRGRGTEVEEDRGDSGEGGEKSEARDDDDDEEEEEEEDGGGGFFDSVDVGDESRVSALREAGFEKAGPLQLRLLIEVDVPESSGGAEGGGGGERIKLTVGGGGAAASVSSLQPLRLAASLPRRYLMPPSLAPSSSSPSSTTAAAAEEEGEEGEEERIPSVAVSAPWLSAPAAARLEARLRSLARGRLLPLLPLSGEEPPPVVFELVELARDSALAEALSAAGGDGGGSLDLLEVVGGNEEDGKHRGDPAADADAAAAALALLRQLVSDDAAQQRERFLRGIHACPICLEGGVPGSRATALPCCGVAGRRRPRPGPGPGSEPPTPASAGSCGGPRAACTACLAALASSALLSRDASALLCPFPDCREPLSPALLSSLLPPERAELAEALRLERALAQMGALRCPHCDFAAVVGDAQGCCLCPSCRHSFCATCFDSWHGSARECSSAEARLALARARRARAERERGPDGSGSGSGGANDRASALALRRAEEEFLSLAAIARSGSKPCPACRTPIERSAGCNRMRCAACSTSFCFVCSAVISEEEGYAHFGSGRCRLLSAEEIARWEREERGPEAAAADRNAFWLGLARRQQGQRQRGGGGEGGEGGNNPHNVLSRRIKVSRCPTCGAQHAGESNDRRCGSCKTRHCGSCGEVLRRGIVHFGRPPKCPAHF